MLGFASYFLVSGGSSLFARLHSVVAESFEQDPRNKRMTCYFHKIAFWHGGRDAALASDPIQVHAGSAALLTSC